MHPGCAISPGELIVVDDDGDNDKRVASTLLGGEGPLPLVRTGDQCAGGEARGEYEIKAGKHRDDPAGWARIYVQVKLYELANCSNDDRDATNQFVVTLQPNQSVNVDLKARTGEKCGRLLDRHRCDDYVQLKTRITNQYQVI